jgi:protein SCO1
MNRWSTPGAGRANSPGSRYRVLILVLAGLIGGGSCSGGKDETTEFRGTLLSEPLAKADFTLTDTDGKPFRFRDQTDGFLTLLFFGYTHCPDVCPVHMANLAAVLKRFPYETRSRVRVVFVSTDPDRDSRERIREWLDGFSEGFIGLRGEASEIDRIQNLFALPAAARGTPDADGEYTVGHAAQILAFSPDDVAHVAYPFGTRQEDWMHDLPLLLKQQK